MGLNLDNIIGQRHIINEVKIHIGAALHNDRTLEPVILYGPPGLGKTTLAKVISKEAGWRFIENTGREVNCEVIRNILTEMEFRDILFIDEIHRMPIGSSEILYGPMQEINNLNIEDKPGTTYIFEGEEMGRFTLIGATTTAGMLPRPLRERFVHHFALTAYDVKDLSLILMQKDCPASISEIIAKRSKGTPRIALSHLVKIKNRAKGSSNITEDHCEETFSTLGIDPIGLNVQDHVIMKYLLANNIVGIDELSYATDIDKLEIGDMHEPYLLQQGLIRRTSRGRELTDKGKSYIQEYS